MVAVLVATLSVGLANLGWQSPWWVLGHGAALFAGALLVRWVLTKIRGAWSAKGWEHAVAGIVITGLGLRFAFDPLPTEWLVLDALRTGLLAMLAVPTVRRVEPVLMSVALALVLACSVLGDNVGVLIAAVGFAALGATWLARREESTRVPWGAVTAVALIAGGTAWMTHSSPMAHLAGLLPAWVDSSGGEQTGDQRATTGLGDGPDQQAGPSGDAGFDRSDFFCETDGQCLYDAFIESYGEPVEMSSDKTQALSLEEQQIGGHREQDFRQGRDQNGPTRRLTLRRHKHGTPHSADAVLWIEADAGQFPLRLPVLAFDHYHGGHWHEEPDQSVMSAMDNAGEDGYFRPVDQPIGGVWGAPRSVSISTGTYDGNVLPMPGGLTSFKMGRVSRADLFSSAAEPMLRVNRTSIPTGSVLDVTYRPVVRRALADEPLASVKIKHNDHLTAAALAREWAGHLPRGWQQIDAIIAGLREYAVHDPDATMPPDAHGHGCPVEQFLHDTRRGDAHLFASSAVLMLRSLGYDARLTGGYYADADAIDAETGRAIVQRRDAHVWPQVRLATEAGYASSRDAQQEGIARGGQWIDLEPTPGFALADGAPTLRQKAGFAWAATIGWIKHNWITLGVVGLLSGVIGWFRMPILNVLDTGLWLVRPAGEPRKLVLRTLRLLDRRAMRRGEPRPRQRSFAAWLGGDLATAADWALHAPPHVRAPVDVASACRTRVLPRRKPTPSAALPRIAYDLGAER